jgi:predicted enzyme related to lactoylglutathione lyase
MNEISRIIILADDVSALVAFYRTAMGFEIKSGSADCIELENNNVRFVICARSTLLGLAGHYSYAERKRGQSFALAFPLRTYEQVDEAYTDAVARGATPIRPPAMLPNGQRAAFFADPEGNIHQLVSDLPSAAEYCW